MRKYFFLVVMLLAIYLGIQEVAQIGMTPQISESAPDISHGSIAPLGAAKLALPHARSEQEPSMKKGTGDPTIDAAQAYLLEHKGEFNLQEHHDFRPHVFTNPLGSTVRFDVFQDGLPLLGAYIDVEMDANRDISSVTSHYEPYPRVDTANKEVLSMEEIRVKMPERYGSIAGEAPSLMLLPGVAGGGELELVYVMRFADKEMNGRPVQILFRATDGQMLRKSVARAEFTK